MFRSYYDPHYKRDRDHKQIVADNRRDERRKRELEADPIVVLETAPYSPGFQTEFQVKETKLIRGCALRNPSSKKSKKAYRQKGIVSDASKKRSTVKQTRIPSQPDPEAIMTSAAYLELTAKLERYILEFDCCRDDRRRALIGTRIVHLREKREKLFYPNGKSAKRKRN